MSDYDFIVIGGGSGGSACARRAAGYGAKVVLIERGVSRDADGTRRGAGVGGTCVNVGCVPKKLMFNASQQRESMIGDVSTAAGNGFNVPEAAGTFDWGAMKTRRDAYVSKLNNNYLNNWQKAGIEVLIGIASFIDKNTIQVMKDDGTTTTLKAPHILIAVGGEPSVPNIPGKELAVTSDGFFDLEVQPKKVAVIGAGYIAVEFAGIFHGLGSDAHLFFRGDTVLRNGFDPFIVETLMDALQKHGPSLHPKSTPISISRNDENGLLTLTSTSAEAETCSIEGFDAIVMAIGRRPVTDVLNLDKCGVKMNEKSLIPVDEYENTNIDGIYAIGDCTTTGYDLTPVAIAAGRRLADRLFGGEPKARLEYYDIATVVFSHPPIGTIGLTEPAARKQFGDEHVTVKQARFGSMGYAFNSPEHKVETGMKLVLVGEEEKVVGLHCIGPASDEMLQGFSIAIRMGATRRDFEASVAIHPTISEEFVTMGGWGQVKDPTTGKLVPSLPPSLVKKNESTSSKSAAIE
mmetsp:Transcript_8965/g.11753  ORF Transcript_8965/g.11753 Transcript_8965/m.11753 type:complete len:518 (+) Transcript_8965:72-1625(+)